MTQWIYQNKTKFVIGRIWHIKLPSCLPTVHLRPTFGNQEINSVAMETQNGPYFWPWAMPPLYITAMTVNLSQKLITHLVYFSFCLLRCTIHSTSGSSFSPIYQIVYLCLKFWPYLDRHQCPPAAILQTTIWYKSFTPWEFPFSIVSIDPVQIIVNINLINNG